MELVKRGKKLGGPPESEMGDVCISRKASNLEAWESDSRHRGQDHCNLRLNIKIHLPSRYGDQRILQLEPGLICLSLLPYLVKTFSCYASTKMSV